MEEVTVKMGKGKTRLTKSKNLVGIKTLQSRSATPTAPEAVNEDQKVHQHLGGFQVFDIGEKGDVDKQLKDLKNEDDVRAGMNVYYGSDGKTPFVPTGDIYITFAAGTSEEEHEIVLDEFNLTLEAKRGDLKVRASVDEDSNDDPVRIAYLLEKCSLVDDARPDMDSVLDNYAVSLPTDNLFSQQWHFRNEGLIMGSNPPHKTKVGADLKVIDAWNRLGNKGSSDITIAVIDNGFDLQHPDLQGNIVAPFDIWKNGPLTDPKRGFSHGTPCAGVALARETGDGTVGVAPNSKFMPLSGTGFSIRDTEVMYKHCIDNGADIISCSWGSILPEHELDAEKEAIIHHAATKGRNGKGCIILYAAGNEGKQYVNYYAQHPDVISVAASTSQDTHAFYSNLGFENTVCAPSNGDWPVVAPKASWKSANWYDGRSLGSEYSHFGGTSCSTPLVAGVCALMLTANPELTAKEVKQILIQTADKVGHPTDYANGHSRRYGFGRVNADKAVAEAMRRADSNYNPNEPTPGTNTSGQGLFRFSVSRQPSMGYGVQIGVFAQYGNVLLQVEKLQNLFGNLPVIVNINELGGKTVYKVIVGQYVEVKEAKKMLEKVRGKNLDGFVANLSRLT